MAPHIRETHGMVAASNSQPIDFRPIPRPIASALSRYRTAVVHIEKISRLFPYLLRAARAKYRAGLDLAIARGWL